MPPKDLLDGGLSKTLNLLKEKITVFVKNNKMKTNQTSYAYIFNVGQSWLLNALIN